MSDAKPRPYSRMELTSPGVRPPLEWARVVATADQFDAFSNDLRDDMETRIAAAVAAEREACAALVENHVVDLNSGQLMDAPEFARKRDTVRNAFAAAIRARGGK